jgi:hypothetical protein
MLSSKKSEIKNEYYIKFFTTYLKIFIYLYNLIIITKL